MNTTKLAAMASICDEFGSGDARLFCRLLRHGAPLNEQTRRVFASFLTREAKYAQMTAKNAQHVADLAALRAKRETIAAEFAAWHSFLYTRTGNPDVSQAIGILGGFDKAQAEYRAAKQTPAS